MKKLQVHCKTITLAVLYLAVPVCLFFLFWLQLGVGIICTGLLSYACYRLNKTLTEKYQELPVSFTNELAIAFLLVFVYLLLTGHGSFIGSEGYDAPWRSAIYQDLINRPWPLVYEASQSALVYYLTYWLMPAGISFLFNLSDTTSNIILILWTYFGLRIFLQLLFNYLQVKKEQVVLVTLGFLFWSGLSLLGVTVVNMFWSNSLVKLSRWGWDTWWYTNFIVDGYPLAYMVRTVFDSLGNIYNQFVPVLLGLMLFLFTRKVKYYALIGLLVLPFSPFGFLGFFFTMLSLFLVEFCQNVRKGAVASVFRETCSRENISAILSVCPVFWLYFTCNSNAAGRLGYFSAPMAGYGIERTGMLLLYYILQFGLFMGLIYKDTTEKKLWWITLLSLMVFPLLRLGRGCDLCWNGSIFSFYLLMILVMQYVLQVWNSKQWKIRFFVVYALLIIAALTPLQQMTSSIGQCIKLKVLVVRADEVRIGDTFTKLGREEVKKDFANFLCLDYQEKTFYKYLAKKH